MLGQIFSALGGSIGNFFGGGIVSSVCRFAGRMLGNYIENDINGPTEKLIEGSIKDFYINNQLQESIPLVFGLAKVRGRIIWAAPINKQKNVQKVSETFYNTGQTKVVQNAEEYEYYLTCAVVIAAGPIDSVRNAYVNGEQILLSKYKHTLYFGTEDQLPDQTIQKYFGPSTPGMRGTAYIVFEDLPLEDFYNKIPNFEFEIFVRPCADDAGSHIKEIMMIPGSGEYVYDTIVQYKTCADESSPINCHNKQGIANSVVSLNNLKRDLPNANYVSLVVCWFADELGLRAKIMPAVEHKDKGYQYSQEWRVGKYDRSNAKLIGRYGNTEHVRYGGTPDDQGVVRYIKEIKSRGYKVALCPILCVDVEGKPWRGHITGAAEHVNSFFTKDTGYNNFIKHYAMLCGQDCDLFIIGSEMRGITSIKHGDNFPGVSELINLAKEIRQILPQNVQMTYAADWSEYHSKDGIYNMDALWNCECIDMIGINAYFPLTGENKSNYTIQDIENGWTSGEGFDFYIDNGQKKPLTPDYAWKNIAYWWSNKHKNPDGQYTQWIPKSKPIAFTEIGFPSIDKATNQPNVFFDPKCSDGGVPKHSNGNVDFQIQQKAIIATCKKWQGNPMICHLFFWTWDARPYPIWPLSEHWSDGYLWEKGHWINGKVGMVSLAQVLHAMCPGMNVVCRGIDDYIDGVRFIHNGSLADAIGLLRCVYFFDVTYSQNSIVFVKRGRGNKLDVCPQSQAIESTTRTTHIRSEIGGLRLFFLDSSQNFANAVSFYNLAIGSTKTVTISTPICTTQSQADIMSKQIVMQSLSERCVMEIDLPLKDCNFGIGDLVHIGNLIRVVQIEITDMVAKVYGVVESFSYESFKPDVDSALNGENEFAAIKGPSPFAKGKIQIASRKAQHVSVYIKDKKDGELIKIGSTKDAAIIATIESFQHNEYANKYITDNISRLVVKTNRPIEANQRWLLLGQEAVHFTQCLLVKQISNTYTYHISKLARGKLQTEQHIHQAKTALIIYKKGMCTIDLPKSQATIQIGNQIYELSGL